jgi:hypothetical protein
MENGLDRIKSNEASNSVYQALLAHLDALGDYEVEVKKTSLHITHGRAFLGVHPRSNGLLLTIVTNTPIVNSRLKKTEQVSANRHHNEVIVNPGEFDAQLTGWIEQAYTLTEQKEA